MRFRSSTQCLGTRKCFTTLTNLTNGKMANLLRSLGVYALGLMSLGTLADIPHIPIRCGKGDTSVPSQEKRRLLRKKRKKHKNR